MTMQTGPAFDFSAVAMLCGGEEIYGVGSVMKLFAQGAPGIHYICERRGPLFDWLTARGEHVTYVSSVLDIFPRGSLGTIAKMPGKLIQARRRAAGLAEVLRAMPGVRIIHANWLRDHVTVGYLRRRGYLTVWHIHSNMNPRRLMGLGPKLNHAMARRSADLIVPVSDFTGRFWAGSGVMMRTLRNAAPAIFTDLAPLPAGPIRCAIAGRLDASKGHHLAVEAVVAARRAGLDVVLDVFGGPVEGNPYGAELQKTINAAGCGSAIQLRGFDSNVRQKHQQYHLGLQCRIDPEPCSVWVCETLVDGLPLIAADNGGTRELVKDGETGLLFRAGDAADLSQKLIMLARDRDRIDAMRHAAFARGRAGFTLDPFIRNAAGIYRELVEKRPAPSSVN